MGDTLKVIALVVIALVIAIVVMRYGFDIDIISQIKSMFDGTIEQINNSLS